jgi:UDP-GlcNAc:undecaprenyl-phosphate GlcNAc-1-phosphate transferase
MACVLLLQPASTPLDVLGWGMLTGMLILLIITSLLSALCCAVLLRTSGRYTRRYGIAVPQRFHAGDVPRLGGFAMLLAWGAGWLWMAFSEGNMPGSGAWPAKHLVAWWAALIIAVGVGVAEDMTHQVHARWRLALTLAAGVIAVLGLDLRVARLDIGFVDASWAVLPWMQVALAVLVVAGLPHAFNLIDGYNGLAGTVAFICAFTLGYVAIEVGDRQLAALSLGLVGASAGFLLWNYPRGLIFAGDGGAYLWGAVLALISLQLINRHAQVSPWFPVLLLIYPMWETVFSMYRKLSHGQSPGVADALHFHQLIYRRVVRQVFHGDVARRMLARNNRTSPYLWGFTVLTVVPAALFWHSTPILIGFTLLFIVSYVWAYSSIVRFRVQRWLPSRRR